MLGSHWILVGKPVVCGGISTRTTPLLQQFNNFSSFAEVRGRPLSWPFGRCQEDAGRGYWELNSGCFEIVGFCFLEWQINQLKQSTKAQKLLFSETLLERRWFFHLYFSGFFTQSCGHTLQWGATARQSEQCGHIRFLFCNVLVITAYGVSNLWFWHVTWWSDRQGIRLISWLH